MADMKSRLAFLGNGLKSVAVYGIGAAVRMAAYEIFYEFKFKSGTSRMVTWDELDVDPSVKKHGACHLPSPYYFTHRAFKRLDRNLDGWTFVDFGCGLGRVLYFASQFPFRRIIGVEASSELAGEAERNLARYAAGLNGKLPEVEVVCCDARKFTIPDGKTICYFGDPFDEKVMETVVENMISDPERDIHVIYVHPTHGDVLTRHGFRTLAADVNARGRGFAVYSKPRTEEGGPTDERWEDYWIEDSHRGKWLYDLIAVFYRRFLIRPAVNHFLGRYFKDSSQILHAGCGSGMVDVDVARRVRITALDISRRGLEQYARQHGAGVTLLHGSILEIPSADGSFDGMFNLGVMEHFHLEELELILGEFNRVLKTGAVAIFFWPPAWGLSVNVLKLVHVIVHRVFKSDIQLHPPEHTHIRSRAETARWLDDAGFALKEFYFGPRDMFTHQIVVAEKVRDLGQG